MIKTTIKILFIILTSSIIIISCKNSAENEQSGYVPYSTIQKVDKQEMMEWNKKLVEVDHNVIKKFIERRKWKMEQTESGLYWQIYQTTDSEQAKSGQTAEFSYKTYLLNGNTLYTSDEEGNRFLRLDKNQEEAGLNEGLKMMKIGEKARFILPPHLAFGVKGDGYKIPIYSIVVYEVELVSLKNPEEINNNIIL